MKNKRFLSLLLCAALLVGMMGVLTVPVSAAGGSLPCGHGTYRTYWQLGETCEYGPNCEIYYVECTTCGMKITTAFRPAEGQSWPKGSHSFTTKTYKTSCPSNPITVSECSKCDYAEVSSEGGHNWSGWSTSSEGNACTGTVTSTRTCTYCGKVDTVDEGPKGHSWRILSESAADCENPGEIVRECNRCGETTTVTTPALGHNYGGSTSCTEPHTCTRCGKTINGYAHNWGNYVVTVNGHYQRCQQCDQTTDLTAHSDSGNGYCVCGKQVAAAKPVSCSHDWQVTSSYGLFNHYEKCSKCGEARLVSCATAGRELPRQYCTDKTYCECGNVLKDGQKNHNFGTWICNDDSHRHACKNSGCQYVSGPESHDLVTSNGITKCKTCSYVTAKAASAAHTHYYGEWTASSNGTTHVRSCTSGNCTALESAAHSGGTPNCAGYATCTVCHASYYTGKTGSHSGGTELRNVKPAEVGVPGYTGDTYCLGCGEKISSGSSIPALAPSHTHSYASTWSKDGTHHWKACTCGDEKDYAEHTYTKGVCTVCGYKDPNYVDAKSHVHAYSAEWVTDASYHWNVCTVDGCKEVANKAVHTIVDGKCSTCGMTLGEFVESKKEEQKPETQKPETQKPETQKPETQKPEVEEPATPNPVPQEPSKVTEDFAKEAVKEFKDVVKTDAFYAAPVGWAVQNNITNGTSTQDKTFSPSNPCTQEQILTMLYRAERTAADSSFKASGSDMAAAKTWAAGKGMTGADFDPKAPCTRATAVYYMWKAADSPDAAGSVSFTDVTDDSAYEQAIAWAVTKGVTNGTGNGSTFSPDDTCNRGQIVTFLYRDKVEGI